MQDSQQGAAGITFAACVLPEDDESTAEEIHALIEREKDDFISLEEYCKQRGID